jgi:hypothetical protein
MLSTLTLLSSHGSRDVEERSKGAPDHVALGRLLVGRARLEGLAQVGIEAERHDLGWSRPDARATANRPLNRAPPHQRVARRPRP